MVNGERRDYVLNGYVGASPVRGHYVEGNAVNDNGEPQGFLVHQPPGAVTPPNFHETDQFQVVVEGSMLRAGETLGRLSCLFLTEDEPALDFRAGEDGLALLVLRLPRPTRPR